MTAGERNRDVERNIASEETRAAHRYLMAAMPGLGLTPSQNSGHVRAVRLHDVEDRYVFSWIPAKRHLLFYIRKPALKVASHLKQSVAGMGLQTVENPAGEITVRVESESEAHALVSWLTGELPLGR